jgi:TIR domain
MVRAALRDAHAIIAICSENARDSEYVALELEIARGYRKRIFPVWVSGEDWPQSAPVALVLSQYVDLRNGQEQEGVPELLKALKRHIATEAKLETASGDKWPFIRIDWVNKHFYLNPFLYKDWGELLSQVYLSLLKDKFRPFSYGETWALEISRTENPFGFHGWPLFALPAVWAGTPFKGVHEVDLDWVHSSALELASVLDEVFDGRGHPSSAHRDGFAQPKARVVDLLTLSEMSKEILQYERPWDLLNPAHNFLGFYCDYRTFSTFAAGAHPKLTVMSLSSDRRTKNVWSRAFRKFSIPQPRFQAVTIQTDYFETLISWQTERISKRHTNIIEFK